MKLHFQVFSGSQRHVSPNSSVEYIQESSEYQQITTPPPNSDHSYDLSQDFSGSGCARWTGFTSCQNCQNRIDDLRGKIKVLESLLHEARDKITQLENEVEYLKNKPFQLKDIEHDDNLVELYTGLPNKSMFYFLLSKLLPKTEKLHYYKGMNSYTVKGYQAKENSKQPGRKRTTTPVQEMFMTLCRFRQNLSEEDISYRFLKNVSGECVHHSVYMDYLSCQGTGGSGLLAN